MADNSNTEQCESDACWIESSHPVGTSDSEEAATIPC